MTLPETIRKWNHTYYLCLNKCGKYVRVKNGLCQSCYIKTRQVKAEYHNPVKKRKKPSFPCVKGCGGTSTKKGSMCLSCYKKVTKEKYAIKVRNRTMYPCKKCGKPISRDNHMCRPCFDKVLQAKAELRQKDFDNRKQANENRLRKKDGTKGLLVCPKNPSGGSHIEVINADKIGVCKFCGRTKDYVELQKQYIGAMGY